MDESDASRRTFDVALALDSGRYLRLQCPHCGLDFKIQQPECDLADTLSSWLSEKFDTANAAEDGADAGTGDKVRCPYCEWTTVGEEFAHPDVRDYLQRIAQRECIEPILTEFLDGLDKMFRSSRSVTVTRSGSLPRTIRPIFGPEPDDQVAIRCLACSVRFKTEEHWRGTVWCPSCATELLPF